MTETKENESTETEPRLHAVLAEYHTPQELIEAAKKVRDAGYSQWDTYSPFPVHGIDPAMGIKPTVLPWIVLCAGLAGFATAVTLQWWTNTVDYPWIISGKPMFSIPANVPVMFELTVLFSAITTFVGMLLLNGLPKPSDPLDHVKRFLRATNDRFFAVIEVSDPKFDEKQTRDLLERTGAKAIEDVPVDTSTSDRLPPGIIYGLLTVAILGGIPFGLFSMSRESKSRKPQIHVVPDMDFQTKYKAQRENTFFADRRSMREPVEGTIAVGYLRDDTHFHAGKLAGGAWAYTFPPRVKIDAETVARGKQSFEVACAPCHGLAGHGDGMVHKRASALGGGWVPPSDVTLEYLQKQPVGQLFDSITNGVRNMPGYKTVLTDDDRWAVVLYLRALQRGQNGPLKDVPESVRATLK